tara:strand:- start:1015 stop:1191 length:177 start_codon:yes stop_codon:yes gene_type:complete
MMSNCFSQPILWPLESGTDFQSVSGQEPRLINGLQIRATLLSPFTLYRNPSEPRLPFK